MDEMDARLAALLAEQAAVDARRRKKSEKFTMVPTAWRLGLKGASGRTHDVALELLHLNWKGWGRKSVTLSNFEAQDCGASRRSKWRALVDLESRGLIVTERRPGKSPVIHFLKLE